MLSQCFCKKGKNPDRLSARNRLVASSALLDKEAVPLSGRVKTVFYRCGLLLLWFLFGCVGYGFLFCLVVLCCVFCWSC